MFRYRIFSSVPIQWINDSCNRHNLQILCIRRIFKQTLVENSMNSNDLSIINYFSETTNITDCAHWHIHESILKNEIIYFHLSSVDFRTDQSVLVMRWDTLNRKTTKRQVIFFKDLFNVTCRHLEHYEYFLFCACSRFSWKMFCLFFTFTSSIVYTIWHASAKIHFSFVSSSKVRRKCLIFPFYLNAILIHFRLINGIAWVPPLYLSHSHTTTQMSKFLTILDVYLVV